MRTNRHSVYSVEQCIAGEFGKMFVTLNSLCVPTCDHCANYDSKNADDRYNYTGHVYFYHCPGHAGKLAVRMNLTPF